MPDASSMIRTVPGGKGCASWGSGSPGAWVGDSCATGPSESALLRNNAAAPTATMTSRAASTIQTDRLPPAAAGSGTGPHSRSGGRSGASSGEDWTATPGPAGVATSDQLMPFHHRTSPGAPSGSGYQPGGGVSPGPVTAPA
jgi:hypothetical protein